MMFCFLFGKMSSLGEHRKNGGGRGTAGHPQDARQAGRVGMCVDGVDWSSYWVL